MSDTSGWRGAGLTDRGRLRPSNQDAFAVMNDLDLWIVADGMGGHAGGEVASRLAVESVIKQIEATVAKTTTHPAHQADDRSLLRQAIESAQQTILDQASAHPELTGMGTTIVTLRISSGAPAQATLAHVGDSRAYLLRAGSLTPLTRDHSLVEDYVRRGLISPDQVFQHPLGHVLTRALGIADAAESDISVHTVQPDDLLLLCTDGLTKMLNDDRVAAIVSAAGRSPESACRALVEEANRLGGEDNITVVVCAASV